MQAKMKDGSVIIAGGCSRDAELKYVGDKQSRVCEVGVAVGKRPDPEGGDRPQTIWCNVKAWHDQASVLSMARKGSAVFAIGRLESRERDGKTYTSLVAEFVSVSSVSALSGLAAQVIPQNGPQEYSEVQDNDGELPF